MKVLVIGSGGREHAILWSLKQTSPLPLDLYCAPGNAGIAELAECASIPPGNHASLIEFVKEKGIDLTIVGPETPLADGIVDSFEDAGLAIAGPSKAAARLEASKAFAKDFMRRHGIPTADYRVARSTADVSDALSSGAFGPATTRVVVKADGLAAGKGVVIADSHEEAKDAARALLAGEVADAGAAEQVVIEEALEGTEASLLLFADGNAYALMPAARDHKRIGEHDSGPNTGGMGAITDASILSSEMLARLEREVIEPTLAGCRSEGFPYRGVLFLGLMLTKNGPRLLEYNVRFGDPETQAILVRLKTSLLDVFQATRSGRLGETKVEWSDEASACVVLASRGYPGRYEKGASIDGLETVVGDIQVFHAGTTKNGEGDFVTSGGRVLGVTASAATLGVALKRCYEAVERIRWDGMQYRRDIGRLNEVGEHVSG
ncbi:MAG: phosphoribosylamine--glycine ligase [bacterium]